MPVLYTTELDKCITNIEAALVNMHSVKQNLISRIFAFLNNKIQQLENQLQEFNDRDVAAELDSLYERTNRATEFAARAETEFLEASEE